MVSDYRHNGNQTPTGRAVRAGAIHTPLVLFWCCKDDKCDEKAIKVVFLVVSGIFGRLAKETLKLQILD